ncbi:hypothetical protein QE152_g29227 [Popillia japonica]|uniref:Uncharacterized protein n=1 Tax=Popillia japonica TaxID=7064 RepID=A0AAW1JIF6_POPJA
MRTQTHSSPTKQLKRKYHEYEEVSSPPNVPEVSSPPNVPVRPKTRLSTSLVPQTTAKLSDPKHYQSRQMFQFGLKLDFRPKTRLSTSLVPQTTAKLSDPKHYQSYTQATSFAQPTFLEDEYIGELLPETPKGEDTKNLEEEEEPDTKTTDHEEEEPDTSESMDLDKSMAHAISLLQRRPTKKKSRIQVKAWI